MSAGLPDRYAQLADDVRAAAWLLLDGELDITGEVAARAAAAAEHAVLGVLSTWYDGPPAPLACALCGAELEPGPGTLPTACGACRIDPPGRIGYGYEG